MSMRLLLLLATCSAVGALSINDITEQTGLRGGLAWVPRSEDAAVAQTLAEGGWQVVLSCPDVATARRVQARLPRALAGGRIVTWVGAPCERIADLVVATAEVDRGSVDRALAPRRGVAWIAGQVWRKPAAAGAAEWSHRACAADNRGVSTDSTVRLPLVPLWYGLPLTEGFWSSTAVIAGGRIVTVRGSRRAPDGVGASCRSLASGTLLWERTFTSSDAKKRPTDNLYTGRSLVVARDREILFALGDRILRLDPESGEERAVIAGGQPGGQVKWIAVVDDLLLELSGEADRYARLQFQGFPANHHGRRLSAYRLDTGALAWRIDEVGDIDERAIAAGEGRIVYHVTGAGPVCRDLASGAERWRNRDLAAAIDARNDTKDDTLLVSTPMLRLDGQVAVIGASWSANLVAVALDDGRTLWQRPFKRKGRSLAAVLADGRWCFDGVYDALTGAKQSDRGVPQDVCSVTGAIPGHFVTAFGEVVEVASGTTVRPADVKSICDIGTLVADGAFFNPAAQCTCNVDIHGARVVTGSAVDPHATPSGNGRLVSFAAMPPAVAEDAADWPTARHDAARSGATPARVGTPAQQCWAWTAPAPQAPQGVLMRFLPTPAVAAHGVVLFGASDGSLVCCAADTGAERWRVPCGGRLFAPPTIAAGRVYVGGGDGAVSCLALHDGSLVWRFDAAPANRLMRWYGHPVSTWPLAGGVTVQDQTVYAVAGYHDGGGLHTYALDAVTGAVRWENHDAGRSRGTQPGTGSYGLTAVGAGRLWLSSAGLHPTSFALADGTVRTVPSSEDITPFTHRIRRGADVGTIGDAWVLRGGDRLSRQQQAGLSPYKGVGYSLLSASVAPPPKQKTVVGVHALPRSLPTPAWDGGLLACAPGSGLAAYDLAAFLRACDGALATPFPKDSKQSLELGALVGDARGKSGDDVPPGALWGPLPCSVHSLVLAADAIVAVGQTGKTGNLRLAVFDRAGGAERWTTALPAEPVVNGLCVARDGLIVVSCVDGQVLAFR
jgi:outer membrane protein assembly factor BamB